MNKNKEINFGNENIVSTIDVTKLRDIEQAILNYMLNSFESYQKVLKSLVANDFTFKVHKLIFLTLELFEDYATEKSKKKFDIEFINLLINMVAYELADNKKLVKKESVLNILSKVPSLNIEDDLNLILFYSEEKQYAMETHQDEDAVVQFEFEDLVSITKGSFIQNRLVDIETTNIENIPEELKDTAFETMEFMTEIDLKKADIIVNLSPHDTEPLGYTIFSIQKDFSLLEKKREKIIRVFEWADKYNLSEEIFPRDINKLEKFIHLDISNKDITELPSELTLLKSLRIMDVSFNKLKDIPLAFANFKNLSMINLYSNELETIPSGVLENENLTFLSLKANKIKTIPSDISKLKKLNHICLCCNKIEQINDNIIGLKNINSFCIHGNKLKHISNGITELKDLSIFSFSNNYVKELPKDLVKLEKLESLEFENNMIKKIDINILKLPKLNELGFDDNLFKYILDNINLLSNIDTINLSASNIDEKSSLIQKLSFKIDSNIWVEKKEKRDNGCIKLTKYKEKNDEN